VFSFRGRAALSEGKLSEAIANFNILASLDTTDYWTFFYRGIAKYNLGDVRGAQKDFDTAVRLNPVFTSGYHYRAITRSRSGDYEKSLEDLEKAISLRPGFIGLYFSRGVTYFLSQQFEAAVKDFNKYIRKEPKDPSAYLNRGASYLFLGDTLKAFTDYNKAIKLDRFDPEGYVRRGRLHAARGSLDDAIADMNEAISLDPDNTFAYFNRALMYADKQDLNAAMADLDKVLELEPGNALTLYNRALLRAQVGDYQHALEDMDRVVNINPGNVLAYYNRAAFFAGLDRYEDALEDYDKAIELYPDFAKAYMNRSWVELQLGHVKASKEDYRTAVRKVQEYRAKVGEDKESFADTTKKYSALLSLDADFAKKDFDDELLQHRDIDINLRPLYKFVMSGSRDDTRYALERKYDNALLNRFESTSPVPVTITNSGFSDDILQRDSLDALLYGSSGAASRMEFLKALDDISQKSFNSALNHYDNAIDAPSDEQFSSAYKAYYYLNRGVLRAEMIDFIASMEVNVQTLSMDDKGNTRARVRDKVNNTYDYSEALADMEEAAKILKDLPYVHFNLGNLYCLSSQLVKAIDSYSTAIALYPYLGDAYFNRALVLIYVKDKEKGCIDLSRAGELGVDEAYSVISKYCGEEEVR
jgi:tetratricopeptide (TPR) repeat protein